MVQDNPIMNELEEMVFFCTSKHKKSFLSKKETKIYIWT